MLLRCESLEPRMSLVVRLGHGGMSALSPFCPQLRTLVGAAGTAASCRYCSLIPGFGVKLSAIILAGPTVLSAVGACPSHDGVRRRWWINVASGVSLIESSQKI